MLAIITMAVVLTIARRVTKLRLRMQCVTAWLITLFESEIDFDLGNILVIVGADRTIFDIPIRGLNACFNSR